MKKIISLSALFIVFFASCMKDKGNYKSTEVDRVQISGIEEVYLLELGERLQIKPEVKKETQGTFDSEQYSYQWFVNGNTEDTFATTKELDLESSGMSLGSYWFLYRVTDKVSGVFSEASFNVEISTATFEGWLLLCDTEDGNSRLDMVSRFGSEYRVYNPLLSKQDILKRFLHNMVMGLYVQLVRTRHS